MPIAQRARSPPSVRAFSMLVMTDSPTSEQPNPANWKQPSAFPPELPCTVFTTVVMGQYPATVSERLRQGPKMVSSAGFALSLHLTSLRHRIALPQPFQRRRQGLRDGRTVDVLGVAHEQELVVVTLVGQHLRHQFVQHGPVVHADGQHRRRI